MSSVVNSEQQQNFTVMVDELSAAPGVFRRLYGDRPADVLRAPGRDGGVAVVEIMAHMQDWEEITGDRVARILREERPELESYDDSLWMIEHNYADRDAWHVLESFTTTREALIAMLRDLEPEAWQRTAELGHHGTVTLAWLIDRLVRHDAKHVQQIIDALG